MQTSEHFWIRPRLSHDSVYVVSRIISSLVYLYVMKGPEILSWFGFPVDEPVYISLKFS